MKLARAVCLVVLLAALGGAHGYDGQPLTARDAGLYVGTAHGYQYGQTPFAFSIEQVSAATDPDELRTRFDRLTANGKRVIFDFFLYEKSDEQAKPAADYLALLDRFLAKLPLERVYAIALSEENIYWNGHGPMLSELYGLVKAKYPGLAVYQWFSPGAGAPGFGWPLLPADGWLIDEYCQPKERFEDLVRRYALLDKPLVHIAWAAPGWQEFAGWDKVWDGQLAVCRRYGVPIAFFCWWPPDSNPPPPGNQSTWSWAAPDGSEHSRVWRQVVLPYVERLRKSKPEDREPLKSPGRPIPVAGDEQDRFEYHDDFQPAPRFVDDAGLSDLRALRWTGERLEVKPDRTATLTYAFESPFPLHDVQASLSGNGPDSSIALSLSADGRRWTSASSTDAKAKVSLPEPAGTALHRFRLRVGLSGKLKWAAAVSDLRVTARVEPPAVPQVTLTAARDGKVRFADDFRSQLYLHAGRVSHPEAVKWQGNALRMYGRQGYANEATVDYHFVCARPLHGVRVTLACVADRRNWGASAALSLSRDGATFQPAVDTGVSDPFRGELEAELGGEPAREFWVRIRMSNVCGVATTAASPVVERLTVEGRP